VAYSLAIQQCVVTPAGCGGGPVSAGCGGDLWGKPEGGATLRPRTTTREAWPHRQLPVVCTQRLELESVYIAVHQHLHDW
jgi:hypothetical protein